MRVWVQSRCRVRALSTSLQFRAAGTRVKMKKEMRPGAQTGPTGVVMQVHVDGLMGMHYLDNLDQRRSTLEAADAVRFTGEVDRIYTGCHNTIQAGHLGCGCKAALSG